MREVRTVKRVFLVAALFFSAAVVRAEYIPSLQSTATCGAVNFVLVATGSIKVEQIVVSLDSFSKINLMLFKFLTNCHKSFTKLLECRMSVDVD